MFLPSFSRRIRGCYRCEVARIFVQNPIVNGLAANGTAISSNGKELYVSTGRGNAIAIIDIQKSDLERSPLRFARGEGEGEEFIAAMIPVGNRAWGIAFDPSGSKLYTANGASNDVSVVDLKSRKELRRIKVGDGPWGIAIVSRE